MGQFISCDQLSPEIFSRSSYIPDRVISNMNMIKECLHCGREYQDVNSDFCSFKCASEVS